MRVPDAVPAAAPRTRPWLRRLAWALPLLAYSFWPQPDGIVPVAGASARDWHPKSFWYEPWGASGVHKGVDIFAREGTPVVSPAHGVVVYAGELPRGGKVVAVLTTGWRIHYFAHLRNIGAGPGRPVAAGTPVGTVGTTGNAAGKPPHLHYALVTLVPYPWRWDDTTQGWKKMFYLDPTPR